MPHFQILKNTIRKIIVTCDRSDADQTRRSKGCSSRRAETQTWTTPAPPPYEPFESRNQDREWNIHAHTRQLEYGIQNAFNQERVQLFDAPIIYDAVLFTPNDERFYRRLLLDATVETDIISEDIAQLLGTPMEKGYGAEIQLPDGRTVKSVGVIETKWQIYRCRRAYNTRFHVVRDRRYDLVLGRTSISQLRLSREERKESGVVCER
jgi:hypothetical protein